MRPTALSARARVLELTGCLVSGLGRFERGTESTRTTLTFPQRPDLRLNQFGGSQSMVSENATWVMRPAMGCLNERFEGRRSSNLVTELVTIHEPSARIHFMTNNLYLQRELMMDPMSCHQ